MKKLAIIIVCAALFLTVCGYTALAYLMDELSRSKEQSDVLSRPYGQGAPRATDYRDDGKPAHERRCVDPARLYEFFDGFTFSIGRNGDAVYYYQGKRIAARTKWVRVKSAGCATAFDRVREALVVIEKERELNGADHYSQ